MLWSQPWLCRRQTGTWGSSAAFFYGLEVKLVIGNTITASRGGNCFSPQGRQGSAGCQCFFSLQLAEPG